MATISATERKRIGQVRPELWVALLTLNDRANQELGLTLAVPEHGGTRTNAEQAAIRADSVAAGGGTDPAYAAAPAGKSRHEYGAAFDEHIVKGGSNDDGTGSDDDYRRLADLAEDIGLTAGYYFADRGVGKKDEFHFQLNEPFQTSVDRWNAMQKAGIVKGLGIVAGAALLAAVLRP